MSIIFHIIHVDHNVACRIYFGSRVKSFRKYGGEAATNGNESPACYANHLKKKSADLCLLSRCGGGNDSGGGWAGASEGPIPAHNNGITAKSPLPACLRASLPGGWSRAPQSKKQKNKQKNSGMGFVYVRTTAAGLAAAPGSEAGSAPEARPAC